MNRDPISGLRLGFLLVSHLGGGRVLTARLDDTPAERGRQQLLHAGLTLAGGIVTDAGVVPLSTLRLLIRETGAAGAAAVDGDRWIVCNAAGRCLPQTELEMLMRVGEAVLADAGALTEPRQETRGFAQHLRKIAAAVDAAAIRRRKMRVAWCAEGAVAARMAEFLQKFDVDAVAVAEPGAMPDAVTGGQCDFGIMTDRHGSAVRLFDDRGRLIPAAQSLAMMLEHILEAFPETITVTRSTGAFADRLAADTGCDIRRGGDGEAGLLAAMQNCGGGLGGDGVSGMLVWRRVQPVPDAFAAIAILLELTALSGMAVSVIAEQTGMDQP